MPHYYDREVAVVSEINEFAYHFNNENFRFKTDHGVFSKDALDYASYLLILYVSQIDLGINILDYGCGWGPIGVILKRLHPAYHIDLVDVNQRACDLAKMNAKGNNVELEVYRSDDILELNRRYDTVILNPPIRAGKMVVYDMYSKASLVLNDNGCLYIIIKLKHGAKSHFEKLKELFAKVELVDKTNGHWLIKATKNS